MDKATKVAVEKYPHGTFDGELGDSLRAACAIGYMQAEKDITDRARFSSGIDGFFYGRGYKQAEKDIISIIESRISEILGDAQPAPVLRAELRELNNKILKYL